MEQEQRYKGQALRRAQQFLDSHGDAMGTVNTSEPRKQLNESVAGFDAIATIQGARGREKVGETSLVRSLERDLLLREMRPISKLGRAKLATDPQIAALTPTGKKLEGPRIVEAARAMGAAAVSHAPLFKSSGFPEDFLERLSAATDAVAASIAARAAQHREQVGATKGLKDVLKSGRRAVHALDAAIQRYIVGNPALMEEWRVAKRVVKKPGFPQGSTALVPVASSAPSTHVSVEEVPVTQKS
jgi:hypothetical protein